MQITNTPHAFFSHCHSDSLQMLLKKKVKQLESRGRRSIKDSNSHKPEEICIPSICCCYKTIRRRHYSIENLMHYLVLASSCVYCEVPWSLYNLLPSASHHFQELDDEGKKQWYSLLGLLCPDLANRKVQISFLFPSSESLIMSWCHNSTPTKYCNLYLQDSLFRYTQFV